MQSQPQRNQHQQASQPQGNNQHQPQQSQPQSNHHQAKQSQPQGNHHQAKQSQPQRNQSKQSQPQRNQAKQSQEEATRGTTRSPELKGCGLEEQPTGVSLMVQAMDGLKGQWKTSYSDLSAIIEVVESESSDEYGWCQGTRELQAVWSEMKAMMADKSTSEGDLLSLWLLKPQPKKALESKYSDRDASSVICACLAKHEPILKRAKALLSKFHRLHDVNCEE
eukprot:6471725-Amphidinium_carterae.1